MKKDACSFVLDCINNDKILNPNKYGFKDLLDVFEEIDKIIVDLIVSKKRKEVKPLVIYTDGSYDRVACVGGFAFVILNDDEKKIVTNSNWLLESTSPRAEVQAVFEALKYVDENNINPESILIITDSDYVKNSINKYIHSWPKRKWLTSDQTQVKHQDLWKPILEYAKKYKVTAEWVKAHSGNIFNEKVNELAIEAMRGKRDKELNGKIQRK